MKKKSNLRPLAVFIVTAGLAAMAAPSGRAQDSLPSKEQQAQMAPMQGYLKAHKDVQKPFELLGGPIKVTVKQTSGGVHVALPDNRKLDEQVFGTPKLPRQFGGMPIAVGVPLQMRGVEGEKYTTLQEKSPFGDKNMVMSDGNLSIEALDATATDAATSKDTLKFEASWKDKEGNTYSVKCDKLIPHGPEYPFFGGVVTNTLLHGVSNVGTPLMPTLFSYLAFWGVGEVSMNGKVLGDSRLVHGMLTEYVRKDNYALAFDDEVTPTRRQFHLILPPIKIVDGKPQQDPVPTGFKLPNGEDMPFWHVMFDNLEINATRQ